MMTRRERLMATLQGKLSSTADNSWMSKINLCQHISRTILGVKPGKAGAVADHAHAEWERNGSEFDACSDQFRSGKAMGSKYYTRGRERPVLSSTSPHKVLNFHRQSEWGELRFV